MRRTHTHRHTDTQTHRHTDTQTHGHTPLLDAKGNSKDLSRLLGPFRGMLPKRLSNKCRRRVLGNQPEGCRGQSRPFWIQFPSLPFFESFGPLLLLWAPLFGLVKGSIWVCLFIRNFPGPCPLLVEGNQQEPTAMLLAYFCGRHPFWAC